MHSCRSHCVARTEKRNAECAEVRRERGELLVVPCSGCRRCGWWISPCLLPGLAWRFRLAQIARIDCAFGAFFLTGKKRALFRAQQGICFLSESKEQQIPRRLRLLGMTGGMVFEEAVSEVQGSRNSKGARLRQPPSRQTGPLSWPGCAKRPRTCVNCSPLGSDIFQDR